MLHSRLQRQFSAGVSCKKTTILTREYLELRALCSDFCVELSHRYLIQQVTGLPESHQKTLVTGSQSNLYPGCYDGLCWTKWLYRFRQCCEINDDTGCPVFTLGAVLQRCALSVHLMLRISNASFLLLQVLVTAHVSCSTSTQED